MRNRWAGASNWFEVSHIVRVAMPVAGIDGHELVGWIERSLELPRAKPNPTSKQLLYNAAAEFRAGNNKVALELAEQAQRKNPHNYPNAAAAICLKALCYVKDGRNDIARMQLEQARKQISPGWTGPARQVLPENWPEFMFAKLLLREAEASLSVPH